MRVFTIAAVLAAVLAGSAVAQQTVAPGGRYPGQLRAGDSTLQSGEYVDSYEFEGRAGQHVVLRLTSDAFDPYLLIRGPANFRDENDDEAQGQSNARLDVRLPADGRYTISATSYKVGESGAYTLHVDAGAGAPPVAAPATSGGEDVIRAGETAAGQLARGDDTLRSGEYVDTWRMEGRAGARYVIRLSSSAFDPYLIVRGPNGLSEENDDGEGGGTASRVAVTMPADGALLISATSYKPGESGAYALTVEADSGATAPPRPLAQGAGTLAMGRSVDGRLEAGDSQLRSGEWVDAYTFEGRRGQAVDVRMTSAAFDAYLMIAGPGDFSAWNDDDVEAGEKHAHLVVTLPADGVYTVRATSFQAGERGAYRLTLGAPAAADTTQATLIAMGQSRDGALAQGDSTLGSGAFVDRYRFRGEPGRRVTIDLRSAAFDSYLTLVAPSGAREQNDDAAQGVNDARIETELAESGDYVIMASSFGRGGVGDYRLSLQAAGAEGVRALTASSASESSGALAPGATVRGSLQGGDATLGSGEFFDRYTFNGRRGETVALEMTSDAIDSYLIVQAPGGEQQDNDDAGDDTHNARVRWVLPETGAYTVRATSYAARETGAYALRFLSGASAETEATRAARRGKVFAVMVGVSDYGGAMSNLAYTADDAMKLAETLRREGVLAPESVTLTNAQATPAAVRAAFQRVAAAAGPDDLFLFFFSGHGGQRAQRGSGEPDLKDETIVLRGGEITDDDLAQMFAAVRARVSLLAIDACFSGGFARDVVSRPGVMGLFSSEEDLTSAVAEKFQAGGYLSHFMRSGLGGEADADGNNIVTAGEMSVYLRRQFAAQASDVEAETGDGARNYQYLVVERGGVKIDDPVLMLP